MNEALLQGAQGPEAYQAAVEEAAAFYETVIRNTGGLQALLGATPDVRVHEFSRNVRARAWHVRLTNGEEVTITDRTPREEAEQILRAAAAIRPPQPIQRIRTSAELDKLFAAAGGHPSGSETEIWYAEKERNFQEQGWVLQYVVDVVFLDRAPDRIEGDEVIFVPREFVSMAFIPDSATDEQGITAIRSAREALIARVAAGPGVLEDEALYFEAGR